MLNGVEKKPILLDNGVLMELIGSSINKIEDIEREKDTHIQFMQIMNTYMEHHKKVFPQYYSQNEKNGNIQPNIM